MAEVGGAQASHPRTFRVERSLRLDEQVEHVLAASLPQALRGDLDNGEVAQRGLRKLEVHTGERGLLEDCVGELSRLDAPEAMFVRGELRVAIDRALD